jgi:hypothetical protein
MSTQPAVGGWQSSDAHTAFLTLGAEVAFVFVLAVLADAFPEWGTVIVVLLLGLWLVWAMFNVSTIQSWGKALGIGG